ncbi:hypothetical protein, partial [Pseudomonas sp. GM49]|uniref:hypothetical protein n=1 Tax=Pseudomonas sp. GM49 TaxID=1144331 RepID=UPI001EE649C5
QQRQRQRQRQGLALSTKRRGMSPANAKNRLHDRFKPKAAYHHSRLWVDSVEKAGLPKRPGH